MTAVSLSEQKSIVGGKAVLDWFKKVGDAVSDAVSDAADAVGDKLTGTVATECETCHQKFYVSYIVGGYADAITKAAMLKTDHKNKWHHFTK